jgi:hypothetical protein
MQSLVLLILPLLSVYLFFRFVAWDMNRAARIANPGLKRECWPCGWSVG